MIRLVRWLSENGFSNAQVARGKTCVSFSGAAAQAESAFHFALHRYQLNGETHYANAGAPLERMDGLVLDLSMIQARSAPAKKLNGGLAEFEIYIDNNREFIPNFGERYRNGETISSAFVESTINQVVSRRFVKRQSMQWTLRGANLLLQARTKVLNGELDQLFRGWYPKFRTETRTGCVQQHR